MKTEHVHAHALNQAHNDLLRDLRGLGHFIQPAEEASIVELRNRLAATYTHVCDQFCLEEQGGYLDDIQVSEPRLQRTIGELSEDHRKLLDALTQIRDDAAVARSVDDVLRHKVRAWIDRFLQHETRENDVIQDAVDSDCGAGD